MWFNSCALAVALPNHLEFGDARRTSSFGRCDESGEFLERPNDDASAFTVTLREQSSQGLGEVCDGLPAARSVYGIVYGAPSLPHQRRFAVRIPQPFRFSARGGT